MGFNVIPNTKQGSKGWLEARRNGVCSTDIAAILGVSRYKTPQDVWREKNGTAHESDNQWFLDRGHALEEPLRKHYSRTFDVDVMNFDGLLQSNEHPHMLASLDGFTCDRVVTEFKSATTRDGWGEDGTDEVPDEYNLQVQESMLVFGAEVAHIGVTFGGAIPEYYFVEADKEIQEIILQASTEFWELVKANKEPDPSTVQEFLRQYDMSRDTEVFATDYIKQSYVELMSVRAEIRSLDAEKERLSDVIKCFMAECGGDILVDADGERLATWKEQNGRDSIDIKKMKMKEPRTYLSFLRSGERFRMFRVKGE